MAASRLVFEELSTIASQVDIQIWNILDSMNYIYSPPEYCGEGYKER